MLREFVDGEGTAWRVWDVQPVSRTSGSFKLSDLLNPVGWLCFESAKDRRRLRPIPEDWHTKDDGSLAYYCARAESVRGTTQDFAPGPSGK